MSEHSLTPTYHLSRRLIIAAALSWLGGQRRSLQRDARELIKGMQPQPCILGQENIPSGGPCLLVANHYKRPDFPTAWLAIAVSAAVDVEITWTMTNAWPIDGSLRSVLMYLPMRTLLAAIARVYGFLPLPSNPPKPRDALERAAGVRRIIGAARANPTIVLGLTPEGRDFPDGRLGQPPPGGGRMIYYLAQMGLKIIPVGVYEESGLFKVHFGQAVHLENVDHLSKQEIDQQVGRQVMAAIADCLPIQPGG